MRHLERGWARSVYIDEAGSICIPQEGLVGQWLATPEVEVPSNRQRDVSLLAALVSGRAMESYVIKDGSMTGEITVEWMGSTLSPLCRGVFPLQPVVIAMDNAKHYGALVEGCIPRNGSRYRRQHHAAQTDPVECSSSQIESYVAREHMQMEVD